MLVNRNLTERSATSSSALRGRVSTGYGRLDEALHGGFLAGSAVVLSAPASDEVPILLRRFLEVDAVSLLISRSWSSAEPIFGHKPDRVKCLVCSDNPVPPVQNTLPGEGIQNLTELNLTITETINTLQPNRLVVQFLSDVLLRHKALQTRKWLSGLLDKFRAKNITALIVLNPFMHAPEEVQAIVDLFNGNIELIENAEGHAGKRLVIKWMHGIEYVEQEIPLDELTQRRIRNGQVPVAARTSLDRKRIAVLPFLNISPDPSDAYFADGLTEELIARLSTISGLKVIARTSIMRFRGTSKSVREIGSELSAGTILEGSVRKAANKLRVTAQLIDASSEEHLWVQNFDRQLEDVFAIQTELAQNVTDALEMLWEDKEHIEKKLTQDIDAYTLYLTGRYYWNERSRIFLEKAIRYFEEAIERDSRFALAYAGLADSYLVLVGNGHLQRSEGSPKIKKAARKALELDETLAEAHASLAGILSQEWDWRGAEEEFTRALRLNPNYATAHHWYSIHLSTLGRLDEAIMELKIAEELDPLSPMIHAYAGILYTYARQYDNATKEIDKALELDPNFVPAHTGRIDVYLAKSMFEEALSEWERVRPSFGPLSTAMKAAVGSVYATAGRTEEAKGILQECEEASAHLRAEDVNHWALAIIHLKLGNKDQTLEWLEKAFEARTSTPFQVKLSPFFDEIASDPRFEKLMKKTLRSFDAT